LIRKTRERTNGYYSGKEPDERFDQSFAEEGNGYTNTVKIRVISERGSVKRGKKTPPNE